MVKRPAEKKKALVPCKFRPFLLINVIGNPQEYLSGILFLDPEGISGLSLGAVWNFIKGTGLS
jgi:hypothetical protein